MTLVIFRKKVLAGSIGVFLFFATPLASADKNDQGAIRGVDGGGTPISNPDLGTIADSGKKDVKLQSALYRVLCRAQLPLSSCRK